MGEQVATFRRQAHATGEAGFAPNALITAMLLPRGASERPLAFGVIYPADAAVDTDALLGTMERGIAQCAAPEEEYLSGVSLVPMRMAV